MLLSDLLNILQWWTTIFFIGVIFIPITNLVFPNFIDRGYIFAKVIGIALISYAVFILGFLKILPFETQNIFLIIGVFVIVNIFVLKKIPSSNIKSRSMLPIFVLEEFIFILILLLWSLIHAHQPEIHGLEKYMDFGFINSVLRAEYFPPKDMWLTPFHINYYYFGHLITAVLTKLSLLPSSITFNLMLSTVSALSFVSAFSIGANLIHQFKIHPFEELGTKFKIESQKLIAIVGGLITASILNFSGNLHTIYLFFKPYQNENPVPFWQLIFSPLTFPNSYWYPNATRFIENTIHEFPLYSYVVSDLHGHVLDIPFVLLTIAVLLSLVISKSKAPNSKQHQNSNIQNSKYFGFGNWKLFGAWNFEFRILLLGFILAIMYMTNAWDGIIYFLLSIIVLGTILFKNKTTNLQTEFKIVNSKKQKYIENILNLKSGFTIYNLLFTILILGTSFFIFSLPFNIFFKPFTSGIGILCAPKFLTDIGNFGPFLFETNHCQRSPLWQLFILYGFFYFFVFSFIIFLLKNYKLSHSNFIKNLKLKIENLPVSDIFILILILLSTSLIIIPEFVYVKDIYPAHYRANTMFKLVYQSFIMLSLSSGYIITRIISNIKFRMPNVKSFIGNWKFEIGTYLKFIYLFIGSICLLVVFLYPYFAVNSYFGNLKKYSGLDGIKYLKPLYSGDYEAMSWINKNIKGQPVILEAQGDSYTDYGRVSANTGLPTVLGWTVHEWLWRGTYDIPSPRIAEVEKMYESKDTDETKSLLEKYKVLFVFIGDLERQKYPNLNEEKFQSLGKIIYQKGDTKIFKIYVK